MTPGRTERPAPVSGHPGHPLDASCAILDPRNAAPKAPGFTHHAKDRMATLGIALDDVLAALATKQPATTRQGCVNFWNRIADGRRIRVTYNPIQDVVVTVSFADPTIGSSARIAA